MARSRAALLTCRLQHAHRGAAVHCHWAAAMHQHRHPRRGEPHGHGAKLRLGCAMQRRPLLLLLLLLGLMVLLLLILATATLLATACGKVSMRGCATQSQQQGCCMQADTPARRHSSTAPASCIQTSCSAPRRPPVLWCASW